MTPGDSKNDGPYKKSESACNNLIFYDIQSNLKLMGTSILLIRISLWVGAVMTEDNYQPSPRDNKKCEFVHDN